MFKANICKTKERQFRQVSTLKIFILQIYGFEEIVAKNRLLFCHYCFHEVKILLFCNILTPGSIQFFFSFLLLKLQIALLAESRFKQSILMHNTTPSGFTVSFKSYPKVTPQDSLPRVPPEGPFLGSHCNAPPQGPTFKVAPQDLSRVLKMLGPTLPL